MVYGMDRFRNFAKFFQEDRYEAFRFGGFLLVVQFLCFPTVFLGMDTFIYRDFGFFGYPLAHYHRTAILSGEWPLWNPLSNMGIPFLAQWNSLTLYPGSLIYMLFPLGWGVSLFCLLHQWFGGLGMYFLVKRWTGNRTAGWIAGIIFSLNGLFLNSLAWPNNAAAFGWFPWMLMTLVLALNHGGRWMAAAALCGGMQMLTGGPEIILFSWVFCGAVAMSSVRMSPRTIFVGGMRLGVVTVWVAGLAAAQLLPFMKLLKLSHRSASYSTDGWSMPITGWGNFLVPKFQTYFSQAGVHFQPEQVWTTSYYLGIFTMVLLGLWLVTRKDLRGWVIFAAVFVAVNLALGPYNPLFVYAKKVFPGLGFMRYPVKFVIIVMMGTPILAGMAWAAWQRCAKSPDESGAGVVEARWIWVFSGLATTLALFLMLYSHLWPLERESTSRVFVNGVTRLLFLWGMVALAILSLRSWRGSHRWAPVALPVVLALELVTHTSQQNPVVSNNVFEPGLVTLQELEPLPVHGRSRVMLSPTADFQLRFTSTPDPMNDYLIYRSGMFSNCNLLEGMSKINGFYSLYIGTSMDIMRIFYGQRPVPATPLKDFLGISHYTSQEAFYEWSPREDFMPMVTSGQKPVFGTTDNVIKVISSEDFKPAEHVFLQESDYESLKFRGSDWVQASIENVEVRPQSITFSTSGNGPSMAVIAQNYYPNWKATIDGELVPLFRANHSFQALEIPEGDHQVQIRYQDQDFKNGLWVSGISLLALVGTGVRKKEKKGTRPSDDVNAVDSADDPDIADE